jgi:hypothetical protein
VLISTGEGISRSSLGGELELTASNGANIKTSSTSSLEKSSGSISLSSGTSSGFSGSTVLASGDSQNGEAGEVRLSEGIFRFNIYINEGLDHCAISLALTLEKTSLVTSMRSPGWYSSSSKALV